MPDQECLKMCADAYNDCCKNCFEILVECLNAADTQAKKDQCKARFEKCKATCKEARDICSQSCA